jgi:pSer/pThr/pTyr-binding forkhead associated (FHA) protein
VTVSLKIIVLNAKPVSIEVTKNPMILGRAETSSFPIKDPGCSSVHCEIRLNSIGITMIKDLGSKNGTFINECVIKETAIYLGDQVKLGGTKISLDPSKMTPEEIKIHTNNGLKRKTQIIDVNALQLEEPNKNLMVQPARPLHKKEKDPNPEDNERTLTSVLKRMVDKLKS